MQDSLINKMLDNKINYTIVTREIKRTGVESKIINIDYARTRNTVFKYAMMLDHHGQKVIDIRESKNINDASKSITTSIMSGYCRYILDHQVKVDL